MRSLAITVALLASGCGSKTIDDVSDTQLDVFYEVNVNDAGVDASAQFSVDTGGPSGEVMDLSHEPLELGAGDTLTFNGQPVAPTQIEGVYRVSTGPLTAESTFVLHRAAKADVVTPVPLATYPTFAQDGPFHLGEPIEVHYAPTDPGYSASATLFGDCVNAEESGPADGTATFTTGDLAYSEMGADGGCVAAVSLDIRLDQTFPGTFRSLSLSVKMTARGAENIVP